MSDYLQHIAEHRRLAILQTLSGAPGYSANEQLLRELVDSYGLRATLDQVRGDLTWLSEQGAVKLTELGGLMIAELTERGADLAAGRASQPGVRRPGPGA